MGFVEMTADPFVGDWRPHRPRGPISGQFKSPGPKYALPSALGNAQQHDKRKNIAPSYSFGLRHKSFTNSHSPGPKFNIEASLTRHGRSGAPQYSIYSRAKSAQIFNTPGRAKVLAFVACQVGLVEKVARPRRIHATPLVSGKTGNARLHNATQAKCGLLYRGFGQDTRSRNVQSDECLNLQKSPAPVLNDVAK